MSKAVLAIFLDINKWNIATFFKVESYEDSQALLFFIKAALAQCPRKKAVLYTSTCS